MRKRPDLVDVLGFGCFVLIVCGWVATALVLIDIAQIVAKQILR
jgi:hypothetical protein